MPYSPALLHVLITAYQIWLGMGQTIYDPMCLHTMGQPECVNLQREIHPGCHNGGVPLMNYNIHCVPTTMGLQGPPPMGLQGPPPMGHEEMIPRKREYCCSKELYRSEPPPVTHYRLHHREHQPREPVFCHNPTKLEHHKEHYGSSTSSCEDSCKTCKCGGRSYNDEDQCCRSNEYRRCRCEESCSQRRCCSMKPCCRKSDWKSHCCCRTCRASHQCRCRYCGRMFDHEDEYDDGCVDECHCPYCHECYCVPRVKKYKLRKIKLHNVTKSYIRPVLCCTEC